MLVVAGLALTEMLEVWHLAGAAILIGAGEAFLIPAYTALVPKLLPADELLAANAARSPGGVGADPGVRWVEGCDLWER